MINRPFTGSFTGSVLSNARNYTILFILWPFLAFIVALDNFSRKEARAVVYTFLIYYGLNFVIIGDGVDAFRYALWLKQTAMLPFSDFFKIVGGIYSSDTTVDIVQPLITFIISRFTENHSLLFGAFAALFGFFYLKSINILYSQYENNPGLNGLIHMIFFIVILPVTSINGFRMWTAGWIFFYGAYHVIVNRDPRFFIVTAGSALVHFSYLSVNFILLVYFFLGNRNIVYLTLLIASLFLPSLLTSYMHLISLRLGGGLQSRVNMYSNEYVIEATKQESEQVAWFMQIGYDLVLYYLIFAIIIIQIWHSTKMKSRGERNLFSFLILFLAFINFGKSIPSLGSRFQFIFTIFATSYVFLFCLKLNKNKLHVITVIGLFPMMLYALIIFRQGAESINSWILLPGFGLPFFLHSLSLAEVLF